VARHCAERSHQHANRDSDPESDADQYVRASDRRADGDPGRDAEAYGDSNTHGSAH
jgi:hypothetical protein